MAPFCWAVDASLEDSSLGFSVLTSLFLGSIFFSASERDLSRFGASFSLAFSGLLSALFSSLLLSPRGFAGESRREDFSCDFS